MSLRFTLVSHLPAAAVRGYLLDRLARATAAAFGTTAPALRGLPFTDRLAAYAEFTAARAAEVRDGDGGAGAAGGGPPQALAAEEIGKRLYRNAESLGADFRRRLGISEPREAFAALAFLYRQIGIDITGLGAAAGSNAGADRGVGGGIAAGRAPSGMLVTRCFFSNFYSPDTCRLMSAFDAGVVAGLFGGASLEFTERITEGADCCRALLRPAEGRA